MIYVQIEESLFSYDGMSLEVVTNMLNEQNLEFIVLDKETYLQKFDAIVANQTR